MEDWTFDLQEDTPDLLGQDFIDLLSQPLENYTFDYSTDQYLYQNNDWLEFQDFFCMSPAADDSEVLEPLPDRDRSKPETSPLLNGYACTTASEIVTQPTTHSPKTFPPPATRSFEDCLSEFAIAQANDKIIRRRNRFSNDRKKEVGHIRKAGACTRCRLTKTACRLELPCASCMKACQDVTLSRTLCTRQKLTDIRFTADLWYQQEDVMWLKEEVPTLSGPRKRLSVSLTAFCDANSLVFNTDAGSQIWASGGHDGPWSIANPLEIVVQDFSPRPGREHRHIFERSSSAGPGGTAAGPQCYAIPEDSLPSLETLELWALETARNHPRAFVKRLRAPFLSLARRYCECKKPLPLQDLMRKVVRMTCLHGIWCSDLPRPRDSRQPFHQYASTAVYRQIGAIVARGIVDTEVDILSLLQKYIFGKKGPGRKNMLPIWTSLWLLILMYRETLFYYDDSESDRGLYQLAQHMYNMLVSLYSGLFRPSSPLWLNWLRDDVYELLGRDWRIMEAMGTLKTEIGQYASGETTVDMDYFSRDSLLRSLVFDQERKLEKKLTEKPASQETQPKVLLGFKPKYFVVEDEFLLPKIIHGLDQSNRLAVIKETSLGANGWARWPPSICLNGDHA